MNTQDVLLTAQDAGLEVKPVPVSARTIRKLFDEGVLQGVRTPRGMRLIPRAEIERLNQNRQRKA